MAGDEARTDALFALVLIYNRERLYDQALQALTRLQGNVPTQPAGRARGRVDGPSGRSCRRCGSAAQRGPDAARPRHPHEDARRRGLVALQARRRARGVEPGGRRPRRPERGCRPRRAGLGPRPGERRARPPGHPQRRPRGAAGRSRCRPSRCASRAAIRRVSTMPEAWRGAPVAGKVKTWVWIVVGIAVFCVLGLVAVVGVGFFYMSRHIETKSATPAAAAARVRGCQGRVLRAEAPDRARSARQIPPRAHRPAGAGATRQSRISSGSWRSIHPTAGSSGSACRSGCSG